MGINMLEMPGMVRQSKEWAELYNDALDRFYMHKLTFTEAHHILVSVSEVLHEKDFNIKIIEDALNKTTINYEINEELNEPVLAKYIPRDRIELTYWGIYLLNNGET
uniref:Uncharacterized protein n=1 Tax=Meloidogyne incognita TaxID=6306 RepID=A0A914N8C6_MELIC